MTRMLSMSLRLGMSGRVAALAVLLHHVGEAVEQVADVVRPGARFRMALEAERGTVGAREALQAAVEERHVRRPEILRQRRRIDGEAVVLAGDRDEPRIEVLHRV